MNARDVDSRRVDDDVADDDPFASMPRFLVVALFCGWIPPGRVVERILAEIESEQV